MKQHRCILSVEPEPALQRIRREHEAHMRHASVDPYATDSAEFREIAHLQALLTIAEKIAGTIMDHVELERSLVKDQLAQKIHADLLVAEAARMPEAAQERGARPPCAAPGASARQAGA
jgi:hypothetical protein